MCKTQTSKSNIETELGALYRIQMITNYTQP